MAQTTEGAGLSAKLLSRYAGPCPRYTSYPTADRFAPLGDAEPWRGLAEARSLSLYIHIPFCRSLCYFCACNKVITQQYGLAASYLEQVLQEARWYRQRVQAPVVQLHLGGGTPTFLSDADLRRLIGELGQIFDLRGGDAAEYSIEADPRGLDVDTLDTLRALGFNRLSLGIQDFNGAVQHAVNRVCSAESVAQLTEAARARGFTSISYDLIYGLPQQTVASLERTLERVLELAPDRIALYHYAHLPHRFKAQRLIDTDRIPAPQETIAMQLAAVSRLVGAGYEFLGMDHFARPGDALAVAARAGRLARNFQGYTLMPADALVGLGASAISYSGDGYWQNAHRLKDYAAAIAARGTAVNRGWLLDDDDRLRQWLIAELMCRLRLDKGEFARRAGRPFDDYFHAERGRLQPLLADGLLVEDATSLNVTERGRWFLRNAAAAFDRYLHGAPSGARYSRVL
ncbi:oxygen-independent coproporphyrinogen III oxidase [Microbulbifer sp. SAOS-129_SWC]|uniref:oxygen-independent coproporphyrinogen III oxidase n=1 Tax=Microbulbifer sp. SAOS-129_SWC TaxID=3145235 RepID=UPI003217A212